MSRPRIARPVTGIFDICYMCKQEFDTSMLVYNPKMSRGYDRRCYGCKSKKNATSRQPIKDFLKSLKESTPCADCQKYFPHYVMDFDHLPEFEKAFGINKSSHYLLDEVKKEIAKCELVCANCHRERTWKRSQY